MDDVSHACTGGGLPMNKALARHILTQNQWSPEEILLAERVLRHNGARRQSSILPTLMGFAATQPPSEAAAWARLLGSLQEDAQLVECLNALLAL